MLFLQGGASLQFSMVPMNLLPAGGSADYIVTGVWAEKAREGSQEGRHRQDRRFHRRRELHAGPAPDELTLDPGAAYVHFTTNNTIYGTQWRQIPDTGDVPLVADTSSDIFSRPIDVSKYGLIYAGAQKNLGPSGLTLVIVREDLLGRTPASLPTMLQYPVHAENKSMFNTPPVFGDLRDAARAGLADRRRAAWRRSRRSTSARPRSSTPKSTAPASTAATPSPTAGRG